MNNKYLIIIIFASIFASCYPLKRLHKSAMAPFEQERSYVVENVMVSDDAKIKIDLSSFLTIKSGEIKTCTLKLVSNTLLKISCVDSSVMYSDKTVVRYFKGKLLRTGVFEVYFVKKRIEVPPLFPIIYSNVSIRRVRLGITVDKRLAIEYKYVNTGNFFLLAAGSSSRDTYYFNLRK